MVGLCGVIGEREVLPDELVGALPWRDDETALSFADDGLELAFSFHPLLAGDQPARAGGGDVLIWVWGDVYGVGGLDDYAPREGPPDGSARFCAELYDRYGMEFVTELNGDFALVIYDRAARTLSFVTDRLGTHALFYARPDEGSVVVSSHLQSLPHHPGVEVDFDPGFLYEYVQIRRTLGVETPLSGVRELPPGSVVTVDLDDGSTTTRSYWRPRYEPVDEPFSTYIDRFVDTFRTVVDEWTRDDVEYGVLLSGGSDSRLALAAMDQPTTAFHIADWMSREATVARRVADTAGVPFHLLERDEDYSERALERNTRLVNFNGWFDQGYFTGFDEEIAGEVDVLVSGLKADTLFGDAKLPTPSVSLGPVGTLSLPVLKRVDSIERYAEVTAKGAIEPLPYIDAPASIVDVIAANTYRDGGDVVCHGVRYGSLEDLVMYGDIYPLSNGTDTIFPWSLTQMRPYRTPFTDNRLLELRRQMPVRYFLRRNVMHRAVERIDPDLAAIPHAKTGVPLEYPFAVDYVGGNLVGFRRKHIYEEQPPEPYYDHGSWPDREVLLRSKSFPLETIVENRDLIRETPFLDYEGALACYREHLRGADNSNPLYSLLTLLEMPVLDRARETDRARVAPRR